jgi:hypothetical protein
MTATMRSSAVVWGLAMDAACFALQTVSGRACSRYR